MQRLVSLCSLAACLAGSLTAQAFITLPANAAGVEGIAPANVFPFGYTGTAFPGVRVQSIYDSSNLTSQGVTGPIEITGIRWRVNGGAAPLGGNFTTGTIGLAAATIDYTAVSTTWQPVTTVYTGLVTVDPVPATTPGGWYVSVAIAPFVYNPTTGQDLIIDTDRATVGNWIGAGSGAHDIAGAGSLSSRTFSSSLYPAANGTTPDHGVVVELSYNPCPRYIPDNNSATGAGNVIPFGTSTPSSLTTVFAQNNGGSVGGAVYFDLSSTANLYVQALDINTNVTVGTTIAADIYFRVGTYAGSENNMAAWTPWTAAKGTAAAVDTGSRLNFNRGLYIGTGFTYGVAVVARNFNHRYTNGGNVYSNADLTVTTGSASNTPFGSTIVGRSANVTAHYQMDAATWHNQIYQTVLRSVDLGAAGSITGLSFSPLQSGLHYNRILTVRMAHKPANYVLSTTFATNITGSTTVLNEQYHTWHLAADRWNELDLTTPFAYNGTSDVVVEIFCRGNHMTTGTAGGFHSGSQERLFAYGWGFAAQPATGTYGASAGLKMRADFRCADSGEFGSSCGPARADGYSTPIVGNTYFFDIHDAPAGSGAILVMGLNRTTTDLTPFGFTNCFAWNDNVASIFKVVGGSGLVWHTINLPNTNAYNGLRIYGFWANIDPTQPGGLTFTNYVRMIIGAYGFTNPNG